MPEPSKERITSTIELMRRGATLLKEACPRCGGLQVKFRERIFCVNEDDLSAIGRAETITVGEAVANLRDLVLTKIQETTVLLSHEKDVERQAQLASLLLRYMELIDKTAKQTEAKKETK